MIHISTTVGILFSPILLSYSPFLLFSFLSSPHSYYKCHTNDLFENDVFLNVVFYSL